jgi:hypothetical protein
MNFREPSVMLASVCLALLLAAPAAKAAPGGSYDDLVALFKDWRAFQKPKVVGGVPDYRPAAMAAQQKELESYKKRLAAIDPSAWPIPQQVDWHLVRAEMNGLDFDHRVIQPWANDPAFYCTVFFEESDQPAREGPFAIGNVELWSYKYPLSAEDAAKIAPGIRAVPGLLAQAKTNLTGNRRDMWFYSTRALGQQSKDLAELSGKLAGPSASLKGDVDKARAATDDFVAWVGTQAKTKTGPSGVGVENYDWYLKNVQLVPYTWAEEVALMQRELGRARALLALEELKNRKLPPQQPVASAKEFDDQFNAAVDAYMAFLKDNEILTVKDYMDPALRARKGTFSTAPLEFFSEIDYRDREVMLTHDYHWFDKQFIAKEPAASPIRKETLLYNIFNTRTEGHATGWEEWMMQAGMFDARPRTRELIYILVAQRAARSLGELYMQSNQMTLEQAAAFACANVPRNYMRLDRNLVYFEQYLYLQQPGYGTCYLIGKIQLDRLLAEKKAEEGDKFAMKSFMDDINKRGMIPAAMLRWEMTGKKSPELERMLAK